jgi:catechol 2,3-dioxygenase-like lactoylglutathione lyase family enzyme
MHINHLDLPVPDVIASRDFFVTFLGFSHRQTLGQGGLAILEGADGLTLVLSRLRRAGSQTYPEGFHIGFYLERPEDVVALHHRLTTETALVLSEPSVQRGVLGFYFTAPSNHLIEVAVRS